jgi:four helix bundle protein
MGPAPEASMPRIDTYRHLEAWQFGMKLVEEIYQITRMFPRDERFGLTAQLRRAAVSIPSNVAEGACRKSMPAYLNHVGIALGSHGEVETCSEVARRLDYIDSRTLDALLITSESTGRLMNGLYRSIESRLESERADSRRSK